MTTNPSKVVKPIGKKPPAAGKGRTKGVPNKATAKAREAIAMLADGNADRLQGWLDDIAADEKQGPAVAFKLFMDVLEYHVPKLARIEHTGKNGGPVVIAASPLDERL